jgi:hypothetical protein
MLKVRARATAAADERGVSGLTLKKSVCYDAARSRLVAA